MTRFDVELTRTIAAPRSAVYRALVDPALLVQWMNPPGFEGSSAVVEERLGGRHRVEYRASDGGQHAFDSVIRELVPDERIVLDFAFEGAEPGQRMGDTLLTLTLRDAADGGTELRLVHANVTVAPPITGESVEYGWNAVLEKLNTLYEKRS
jgi:uncharacterized protein YndB with AHSA1/START domain